MRDKKWEDAVVLLRSALRAQPDSDDIALDLVRALTFSGRREEALSMLSQRISRKKGGAQKALARRARVLSRIFLTNNSFQMYQDGLNLMLAGKYRPARERFDKVLEMEPANVEVLTRLGQCLVLENDYDSAAEQLRLARRLNEYEPDIQLWLGRALHQRGEVREAATELRAAYDESRESEVAAIWYADVLASLGQKAQAISVLDEHAKRNPIHVEALADLARLRLGVSSPRDTQAAWQVRKDLQIAVSRLPAYLSEEALASSARPGGLSMSPRKEEPELKKELGQLMSEAEGRIEGLNQGPFSDQR